MVAVLWRVGVQVQVSRRIGIPLTCTGRRQKLGSLILRLLGVDKWV